MASPPPIRAMLNMSRIPQRYSPLQLLRRQHRRRRKPPSLRHPPAWPPERASPSPRRQQARLVPPHLQEALPSWMALLHWAPARSTRLEWQPLPLRHWQRVPKASHPATREMPATHRLSPEPSPLLSQHQCPALRSLCPRRAPALPVVQRHLLQSPSLPTMASVLRLRSPVRDCRQTPPAALALPLSLPAERPQQQPSPLPPGCPPLSHRSITTRWTGE